MDRNSHVDGDLPDRVERHIDFDDIDEDLLRDIAHEVIVRATCSHCGHEDLYIDLPRYANDPECKGDCDEKLLFPS